jgi:hypothetical protein
MTNGSLNKFHFNFWLPFFAILLLLIPVLIWQQMFLMAKLSGIVILIGLLIALKQWFAVARQINNRKERYIINTNERFIIESLLPSFKSWSKSDQAVLTDQLGIALTELNFTGESSFDDKFKVALQIVVATWGGGYTNKQQWLLAFNSSEKNCSLYINEDLKMLLTLSPDAIQFSPTAPLTDSTIIELAEKLKNLYL